MKNLFLLFLLFGSIYLSAQEIFVESNDWQEILELAKNEQKPIFFDGYTKSCKPCKVMDKKVFTDDKVAQFLNYNFVNVKVDLDSKLGLQVNKNYNISVYPTLLILNNTGQIEARHVGGLTTNQEFMNWISVYADQNNHKSALEEKFEHLNQDPEFLQHYAKMMSKSLFSNASALDQLYHLEPEKYYQFYINEINSTRSTVLNSLIEDLSKEILNEIVMRCQERIFYTQGINPKTLALSVEGKPEESYQAIYRYENK